jgi:hypothetical protein
VRKTSDAPPPFRGLWSRLTAWNVLEYKGPTVSPRFDELHELTELGLGIHRRLNEMQAKARLPEVDYAETSFWYLVNHIGRRFQGRLQRYLPDVERVTDGVWQAHIYSHPVLLVSVKESRVERDSMPLHVLAGVPEDQRGTIAEILKAEPGLWSSYSAWMYVNEPEIWEEIAQMAAKRKKPPVDYGPLIKYMEETNDVKRFLETMGAEQALAAFGEEEFLANLPPERREKLRQLLQQQSTPAGKPKKG